VRSWTPLVDFAAHQFGSDVDPVGLHRSQHIALMSNIDKVMASWREGRLTEILGIEHPIISAPMAFAAGGKLAAAVMAAGGLGLIGGGYGDAKWLEREFSEARNTRVGCGFITWSLAQRAVLLELVLAHSPAAVMLSFGSPAPFASRIKAAGVKLICQVQNMEHARAAVDVDADIIVAQGAEAGGHGLVRTTFTLVPEIADYLAKAAPATVLVAAGGVADGRGLAAALMLGAEGALIGSRFWASAEALVRAAFQKAAIDADGDATTRTTVVDIVRNIGWPKPFTARVMKTSFVNEWHGREAELTEPPLIEREMNRYLTAMQSGDPDNTGGWVGEAAGLINDVRPAADLLQKIVADAERLLGAKAPCLVRVPKATARSTSDIP
jgi:nitronate monooxygenase